MFVDNLPFCIFNDQLDEMNMTTMGMIFFQVFIVFL